MNERKVAKKLNLHRETLRKLTVRELKEIRGGCDNSDCYCPGGSDPNSCVAECGI